MVMVFNIDYEYAYKHNFREDLKSAIKFYLNLHTENNNYLSTNDNTFNQDCGKGFIIYPKALNPFLKVMENINESKNIFILPAFNNDCKNKINAPAYLILKIPTQLNSVNQIVINQNIKE